VYGDVSGGSGLETRDRAGTRSHGRYRIVLEFQPGIVIGFETLRRRGGGNFGRMQPEQRSDRVAQLRRLAVEIDQLPPTRARSLLLEQVRTRLVSVDSGPAKPSGWAASQPGALEVPMSDREELAHALKRTY
jgi:hypothetical protein